MTENVLANNAFGKRNPEGLIKNMYWHPLAPIEMQNQE